MLSIDQDTVRQIYYQNPAFGFELIGLVAGRLSADVAPARGAARRGRKAVRAAEP